MSNNRATSFPESRIVDGVHRLNTLVDNLVRDIVSAYRPPHPHTGNPPLSVAKSVLGPFFVENRLTPLKARAFVLEFLFRNAMCYILFTHYFEGDAFFGVGSETRHKLLERMMTELIALGRFAHVPFYF